MWFIYVGQGWGYTLRKMPYVCECSYNKGYRKMQLTEVNGSSRQGVPVELRDE